MVIELAGDAQFARDLEVGGVFVPGCSLRLAEECDLVVRGASLQLSLPARVVYVEHQRGAGLELIGFSNELKARLAELGPAQPEPGLEMTEELDTSSLSDGQIDLARLAEYDLAPVASVATIDLSTLASAGDDDLELDLSMLDDLAADEPPPDALARGTRRSVAESRAPRNVHERLRGLSLAAQVKLAAQGELHERIVLERLYGKNVWEALLRNPRLTAPEVARIARFGSLPRVLLEMIVGNGTWLQVPEVRRALLANPRLGTDQVIKVLRLTPKHELRLAAVQTAYPFAVRNAARMLLKEQQP